MEELAWLRRAPSWTKRLFFALVDVLFWDTARRQLNTFRREIGLPQLRDFYDDALHGAEGVAALFPACFASPQPDWPPRVRQFGFPIANISRPLPDSLENFLASDEPPVVWTHGSANFDLKHFQSWALAVSRELNLRCLLISLDTPSSVSDNALHVAYARFEDLFPRCKAIVHHGGIGTTAKCIAAGVLQLIIPRSHDQPDNAQRVVKLNLGKALSYHRADTRQLATTLARIRGHFFPLQRIPAASAENRHSIRCIGLGRADRSEPGTNDEAFRGRVIENASLLQLTWERLPRDPCERVPCKSPI